MSDKPSSRDAVERTVRQITDSVRQSGGRVTDERQIRRDVERIQNQRDQREGK